MSEEEESYSFCGKAWLFLLCPAYIKHALLLQLEQEGKQCHQVRILRIPRQIDPSPNLGGTWKKDLLRGSHNWGKQPGKLI